MSAINIVLSAIVAGILFAAVGSWARAVWKSS